MLKFLTGAAAIALAASAVSADPGGGKGGGDHAAHAQAAPGGGQAKGNVGGNSGAKQDRGNGGGNAAAKQDRGNSGGGNAVRGPGKSEVREARGNGRGNESNKLDRPRNDDRVRQANGRRDDGRVLSGRDRDVRIVRDNRGGFDWDDVIPARSRGLVAGCPPGLAKKGNGCMPPGLARASAAGFYDRPDWWGLNDRWHDGVNWNDGSYRYYDGYMVQYGNGGIESWLPLLGGALAPGNLWPSQYQPVDLPPYYEDYYGLGAQDGYRYYDDTLFRVDPSSNAITSIAALLTGDSFGVGQTLPQGYDVYNVPYSYRDQYVDGPDAAYRYSDGYVYEVDPATQLIQAAIQLLT